MQWTTEIVNGECPECEEKVLLINLHDNFYRCINCGYDVEQKVNGVIKYIKLAKKNDQFILKDDG